MAWNGEPQVRASWCKLVIATVKREPEPRRSNLLGAMADVRTRIRQTGLTAWTSATDILELGETMEEVVSPAMARTIWARCVTRAFERPMLSPIVSATLRLYGNSPAATLRMAPKVHGLVSRGCGKLEVQKTEDGGVDLGFSELPRLLCKRRTLLTAYMATCDAVLKRYDRPGSVVLDDKDLMTGCCRIEVRWVDGCR